MPEPIQQLIYEEKPSSYSTFRDYVSVVFRHKWKGLFFFLITVTCVIFVLSYYEDPFRAEAKLLVRPGWESMNVDPTATTSETGEAPAQPQAVLLNTMLDIIQSKALAEKVVDSLGSKAILYGYGNGAEAKGPVVSKPSLTKQASSSVKQFLGWEIRPELNDRDKAIKLVMENTQARVTPRTQIISISFVSESPELARDVVRELTSHCLEMHKLVYRNPHSLSFLEDQEKEKRAEVKALTDEFRVLKEKTGLTSVVTRIEFVESHAGALEQLIDQANADIRASEAKIESYKKVLADLPETHLTEATTSSDYTMINSLREQLHQAQNERLDLLSRFSETADEVKEKDKQIANLISTIEKEEPRQIKTETIAMNNAWQEVESSMRLENSLLQSLRAKAKELNSQLAQSNGERRSLIGLESQYSSLETRLTRVKEMHARIESKLNQARMEQTLEEKRISNISEIQPATLPLEPEKSRKLLFLLVGFVFGIVGGIVLTFVFEFMDHTLKTPKQVEMVCELPALTSIPNFSGKQIIIREKAHVGSN